MKTLTKNILIGAISLLAVSGATFGILQALDTTNEPTGGDTPPVTVESYLSTPKNIELSLNLKLSTTTWKEETEYILAWDYVTHAEKFCITVGEKEFYTTTITQQSYDISSAVTAGETYDIKVKAIGDGVKYGDSENGVITETIKKVTPNLVFNQLEDGTYEVSKKENATINGELVLPDCYENEKVTKIAKVGFKENLNSNNSLLPGISSSGEGIASIRFPKYLTSIEYNAFMNCSNLRKVTIPENITNFGNNIFDGCINLTEINFPKNMTRIPNGICRDCSRLISVTLPESLIEIGEGAFWYNGLTSIEIPKTVMKIERDAFSNTKISSIDIPTNIKTLNGFSYTKLMEVVIPVTVETIGNSAFEGCRYLQKVKFAENSRLTTIGDWAFAYTALTEIKIPASVTSVGKGFCAGGVHNEFGETSKLTNIIVAEGNTAYKTIDGDLYTMDGTLLVQYAGGKTDTEFTIPDGVETIGASAFCGSSFLKRVTIHKEVALIDKGAFADSPSLEYVNLPLSPIIIENSAFHNNPSLKILKIYPHSINEAKGSADYIEYLEGWTEITGFHGQRRVVVPKSVTEIGNLFHFFWLVGGSKSSDPAWIYYKGTAEEWEKIVIRNDYIGTTNLTIYYYSETEPPLNSDGTGYDGNYWYYDENGVPVVWVFEE